MKSENIIKTRVALDNLMNLNKGHMQNKEGVIVNMTIQLLVEVLKDEVLIQSAKEAARQGKLVVEEWLTDKKDVDHKLVYGRPYGLCSGL